MRTLVSAILLAVLIGVFPAWAERPTPESLESIPEPESTCYVIYSTDDLNRYGFAETMGGLLSALRTENRPALAIAMGLIMQNNVVQLVPELEDLWRAEIRQDNRACVAERAFEVCVYLSPATACENTGTFLEYLKKRTPAEYEIAHHYRVVALIRTLHEKCNVDVRDLAIREMIAESFDLNEARLGILKLLLPAYGSSLTDDEMALLYTHWCWDERFAEKFRKASGKPEAFFKELKSSRESPREKAER